MTDPAVRTGLAEVERVLGVVGGTGADARTCHAQLLSPRSKRLRPAVVLLTARLGGAAVRPEVVRAAAGLELLHEATLYHDDIVDEAPVRRGRPSTHAACGAAGVPGDLVDAVRAVPGVRRATPLCEGFVGLADTPGEMLAVLGFDLLGENPYESQLPRSGLEIRDEIELLNQADSIVVPRGYATARGLGLESRIDVMTPGGRRTLVVRGLADAVGPAALFGGAGVRGGETYGEDP